MIAVLQRVKYATVSVDGEIKGKCNNGFLILYGAENDDTEFDNEILARKVAALRVFSDDEGKMNKSVIDVNGEILVVSQFTLCADVKKGNRPSFIGAMRPDTANEMYEKFCDLLKESGVKSVEKGVFGADMQVELLNDGPVTVLYDTKVWRK